MSSSSNTDILFQGPGEMRALWRELDWAQTSLGPASTWPQSLRTAAQMVLANPFPNVLLWGPDLIQLYNDGYRELMGNKHPAGLGQPTRQCWPEVWHINQPIYQRVWAGESISFEDGLYPITRSGRLEEAWFTLAYSPVLDESEQVGGVLVTVFETTDRVREQRQRQHTLQALQQSEQRFGLLVRATSEMIYTMSADWQYMIQLDGKDYLVSTDTTNGTWLKQYIPPDEQERVWTVIQRAIDQKIPFEAEHQVFRQDGSVGWIVSRAIPILDEKGRIQQWVGAASDITHRKQTQEALQESEQQKALLLQLSDLLQTLTHPVQVQDAALRVLGEQLRLSRAYYFRVETDEVGWVHRIESAYQREPDQPSMIGSHSLKPFGSWLFDGLARGQVVAVSDVTAVAGLTQDELAVYRGLGVRAFLNVPLLRQGSYSAGIAVHSTVSRNWKPSEIALIQEVALRTWDAVERARAEASLKESEEKYRAIFNSMEEGFSLLDIQFDANGVANDVIIRDANPAQDRIDGVRALIGKRIREFLPDIELKWIERYAQIVRSGEPAHFEDWSEANQRWYEVNACRVGGPGSSLVAIVYNDVTDRKKADEALRLADRRKDEFLAMLAHELRNPMSTLHNTLLLLSLTKGQDGSLPLDKAVDMMTREVGHLNRMVDDLLDVSRITRGKIELRKQRLDLSKLVAQAIEGVRPEFSRREQTVTLDLPPTAIWVDGDATRLTQVVRNLAVNAAKYTPNGGQISVLLEKAGGQAELRIRDNGIGIAADQLRAIFEVFVQVSTSLDRPQGGLGLGLAVVKQLVELHQGQVAVDSPGLGQGSEFRVTLPLLPDRAPLPPRTDTGSTQPVEAQRILVVDDNAYLTLTTAMLLRMKKFEVHTRLSGLEALEAVELLQPAVVLLDLGMPEMDGYETARRLRQLPWGRHGIIVALTGYGGEEDKQRTKAEGFDGHLTKPVDLNDLTDLLTSLLGKSR